MAGFGESEGNEWKRTGVKGGCKVRRGREDRGRVRLQGEEREGGSGKGEVVRTVALVRECDMEKV